MKTPSADDVKFLPKDARDIAATLIYLVYHFDNARFKYSTGQRIEPFQWDGGRQRAHTNQKNRAERGGYETINAHLDRHRAALIRIVTCLQLAGIPFDNAALKQHLDAELDKAVKPAPAVKAPPLAESFNAYIERFVDEAERGRRLNHKSVQYARYTLAGYMKLSRKYGLVTSHTARRSFAANAYLAGVNPIMIM